MANETKQIRISTDIHRKLKLYAAKAELSSSKITEQALLNFMKEYSADFFTNSCTKKSKTK